MKIEIGQMSQWLLQKLSPDLEPPIPKDPELTPQELAQDLLIRARTQIFRSFLESYDCLYPEYPDKRFLVRKNEQIPRLDIYYNFSLGRSSSVQADFLTVVSQCGSLLVYIPTFEGGLQEINDDLVHLYQQKALKSGSIYRKSDPNIGAPLSDRIYHAMVGNLMGISPSVCLNRKFIKGVVLGEVDVLPIVV